jgi:hypothetical protein
MTDRVDIIAPEVYDDLTWPPTQENKLFVEGFASGVATFLATLISCWGDHRKSYDPLRVNIDRNTISSYLFDLKEGGRGHDISSFSSVDDLLQTIIKEAQEKLILDKDPEW